MRYRIVCSVLVMLTLLSFLGCSSSSSSAPTSSSTPSPTPAPAPSPSPPPANQRMRTSDLVSPGRLGHFGDSLFFVSNSGTGNGPTIADGFNLWISDGTAPGTRSLWSSFSAWTSPVYIGSGGWQQSYFTFFNGRLIFNMRPDVGNDYLWWTDGSAAGKYSINGNDNSYHASALLSGNLFVFAHFPRPQRTILYKVGNPMNEVVTLYEISSCQTTPSGEMVTAGNLLFTALDYAPNLGSNCELWASDGTAAGTHQVSDINPDPLVGSNPGQLTPFADKVMFAADDGVHGRELWISDGTAAGTALVKDISPGAIGSSPLVLGKIGAKLLFSADNGVHGRELWASDGTAAGTALIKDINPLGSGMSADNNGLLWERQLFFPENSDSLVWGSQVYFPGNPGTGIQLWTSDGTAQGTVQLGALPPLAANTSLKSFARVGSRIYFVADDGTHGAEIWFYDVSAAQMALLEDLNPNGGSNPSFLTEMNGRLYYFADDGSHGRQLWSYP